jgi:hypothetical protein
LVRNLGSYHTRVAEATLRGVTHRHGAAAEALVRQEVEALERDALEATAQPGRLLVSVDGAFVQLTSGEWREVKSVALGEFAAVWNARTWEAAVKTNHLSYFSRSYPVRDFERYALAELHRRGLENAATVVAVNDGSEWIQNFLDYHCPQSERIIDFAHAASYVAQAGKAVWDEESETFQDWYSRARHALKHKPPDQTIANLRLLEAKVKTDAQAAQLAGALFYLQSRLPMLDYAHFRHRGYPIGSGSVESGHKVVVQRRMKGAGMRWEARHLDPMLALRNLICNGRWEAGWQQIVLYQQEQEVVKRVRRADAKQPSPSEPITFARLKRSGLLPEDDTVVPPTSSSATNRPNPDHPWRKGIWPTREAWRWN